MRGFDKKDVVEGCLSLDASAWRQAGILQSGVVRGGYWEWPRSLTLGYILDTQDLTNATLWLIEPTSRADVSLVTRILLDTTLTPKGGVRLWWRCPECSRRCGKLFQPRDASLFACRWCHDLAYVSTQQNHCHDRLHERMAAHTPGTTPAHWHEQKMLFCQDLRLSATGRPVEAQ